ncbi:GAF domain-containing sensor histidine kinase [Actinoplanes sp. CA-030573]|uniref:GAF domain-containing sensor histidine kinase n=1 Tax=Actinoplanes sp. CA-030573 TaxID=3239898 RepID=UPI003D8A3BB0
MTGAKLLAAARYRSAAGDLPEVLELAADVCQAPMAALEMSGPATAHFAATWNIPATVDVRRSRSLSGMVSAAHDALVVDDAAHDPRVADHPLVVGAAHVDFIAAAPLHHDGHIVGALCVFDNERRRLDAETTRRYLGRLARRVDTETSLRHLLAHRSPLDLTDADDVVTTVSHEIRTPLTAIQGYAEMLADTPGAISPAYAAQMTAIGRNTERLCRTVDTLLRAVNQQRHEPVGERRTVDLASVVALAAAGFDAAAARVRIDTPARPVQVLADGRLLGLAIGHLLRNALGFSGDRPVTVTIGDRPRPVIEIRDRGPGLDEPELARLGTPFFRGDHARRTESPGVGLGIAVTQQIIQAQGAGLRFAGAPGGGLVARIQF